MRILQLLIPVTLLGACSIVEPARMRLPSDLAETSVRQPFAGIGGGTRGRFEVGAYHGSFTRSERRLAVFDVFVKNHGHTSFVMSGPAIGSTIATTAGRLRAVNSRKMPPEWPSAISRPNRVTARLTQ